MKEGSVCLETQSYKLLQLVMISSNSLQTSSKSRSRKSPSFSKKTISFAKQPTTDDLQRNKMQKFFVGILETGPNSGVSKLRPLRPFHPARGNVLSREKYTKLKQYPLFFSI